MEPYSALLFCKGIPYKSFINMDIFSDDELTIQVNGIKIHIEFDGSLYIEPEDYVAYSDEQLEILTLSKRHGYLFLVNYSFSYRIPITAVNKQTNDMVATFLEGEIKQQSPNTDKVDYLFSLFDAKSQMTDIEYAIHDIRKQLSGLYDIHICACCKYGQSNPYGGDTYLNYLCFRKNKNGYLQFHDGVEKKDWEYFTDEKNAEPTRPFYSCEEFA